MKTLVTTFALLLSLHSLAKNEQGYQLDMIVCGTNDSQVLGKICLMEVFNDEENFAVIIDKAEFESEYDSEDVGSEAIMIDIDKLNELTRKEYAALKMPHDSEQVYKISLDDFYFFDAE